MGILDLFKPKWQHSDPEVRITGVLKITKEEKLIQIIKDDSDKRVKQAAWGKMAEIKSGQSFSDFSRELAVKKIEDQEILVWVAKNDVYGGVRREAVKKIKDHNSLELIAIRDENEFVRIEAYWKLGDQKALVNIAKKCYDSVVFEAALKK